VVQVAVGDVAGQDHRGDRGVAARIWPGSQDASQPFHSGACRAVRGFWSLVMVVSLMVIIMAVMSERGS
jgi:hypothetical protein